MKRADCVFDDISIEAEWWLAATPDKQIHGRLDGRVAGNFLLSTEGLLGDDYDNPSNDLIILGQTRSGVQITLLQCFRTSTKGLPGVPDEMRDGVYYAHWVLVGAHFAQYEAVRFRKLTFGLSNLEEWYDIKCFDCKFDPKQRTANICYQNPDTVGIATLEGVNVTLGYSYKPAGSRVAQKEAKIEHAARITMEAQEEELALYNHSECVAFSFFEAIQRIEAFLSLAMSRGVYPYDIAGYFQEEDGNGGKTRSEKVEIYRTRSILSATEPISWHEMLFSWKHVAEEPQAYFNQWMRRIREIGLPVWLYLGSFQESMHDDQRFMELARALEGFHRYRFPSQSSVENTERRRLTKRVREICDNDGELKGVEFRIDLGPTLRQRLLTLFSYHDVLAEWIAGTKERVQKTISLIVKTRNAYAHGLDEDSTNVFTGRLRYRTIRLMRAIQALLLLEEAGFKKEQIVKIGKSSWEFKQLRRYFVEE